jgi:hypothetical protein
VETEMAAQVDWVQKLRVLSHSQQEKPFESSWGKLAEIKPYWPAERTQLVEEGAERL